MSLDTRSVLEAVLFVATEPLPETELASLVELSKSQVRKELEALRSDLEQRGSGIALREVGEGWRLYARSEARPYLELFGQSARVARLSKAALETLAVVAYRQPVTKAQVSEIRGVDADTALTTLEERGLISEAGRMPGPGQAILFATTPLFLEKLGMRHIEELPPLADYVPPPDVVEALERPFRTAEPPSSDSTS